MAASKLLATALNNLGVAAIVTSAVAPIGPSCTHRTE